MSFLDFCFSSNWEREWYTKFGYKGEMAPKLLILFFEGFHWRIFLLSRANRLCSIFLHWLEEPGVPRVSVILLSSTQSKMAMVRLPRALLKKTYLLFTSAEGGDPHFRFGVPANHLASLSLLVSGDLRLLSTNTCWYPLCDLHSLLTVTFLTARYCQFKHE